MNQQTNGFDVQGMVGSQPKDTKAQAVREAHPKLFYLLDAAPVLTFSKAGRENICRRFQISEQTLDYCLLHYLRPGEPETEQARRDADLQRVITNNADLLEPVETPRFKAKGPRYKVNKAKQAKEGRGRAD